MTDKPDLDRLRERARVLRNSSIWDLNEVIGLDELDYLLAQAERVEELEAWIRLSAANWEILRVGGFRLDQARGVASSMIASLSDDLRQPLSKDHPDVP